MAERILLFVPMYNCEKQIGRVLSQLAGPVQERFAEVLVVDNRSYDFSVREATQALQRLTHTRTTLLQNDRNYGLGGSHKVAFDYALTHGFDYCVVLHGDDQADVRDLLPLLDAGLHRRHDALLGSRFMRGARLVGYSRFRTFGNHVFNLLFSLASASWVHDLGAGLNLYAVAALRDRFYLKHANDLTFNNYLLLAGIARQLRMRFFPLSWREEDQVSNVKLFRQAWKTLCIALGYFLRRGHYLDRDHSGAPGCRYSAHVLFQQEPSRAAA